MAKPNNRSGKNVARRRQIGFAEDTWAQMDELAAAEGLTWARWASNVLVYELVRKKTKADKKAIKKG